MNPLGPDILQLWSGSYDCGNRLNDLSKVEWLDDYAIDQVLFALGRESAGTVARNQNHIHFRPAFANFARGFPAIHFRHGQVSKYEVAAVSGQGMKGIVPALGQQYAVAHNFKHF